MKKMILLLPMLLSLSACSPKAEDAFSTEFSVTLAQIDNANATIQDVLDTHYWAFDANALVFEEATVTESTNEYYEKISVSSSLLGYDFKGLEGQRGMLVSVPLFHSSGDDAGTAKFHFIQDDLVAAYYVNTAQIPFGLHEKNTFSKEMNLEETRSIQRDFSSDHFDIDFDYSNIVFATNSTRALIYSDDTATILDFDGSEFRRLSVQHFSPYTVIDATFMDDGKLAVLFGNAMQFAYSHDDESDIDREENVEIATYLSVHDPEFNEIVKIKMASNHTALHFHDGSLIAAKGQELEFYELTQNTIQKTGQMLLGDWVSAMQTVTLDTENALILTNGVDLFLYSTESPALLWRTHLPTKSFFGTIYSADLNADGVQEIYVHDQMGNTIQYYFTRNEIKAQSLDYGYHYLVADFDNNGLDDYIRISLEDLSATLYRNNPIT